MPIVGYQKFLDSTKDHKPAVQQTLKPILEKIKSSSGAGNTAGGSAPKAETKKVKEEVKVEEPAPVQNSFAKKADEKKKVESKKVEPKKKPEPKHVEGDDDEDGVQIKVLNKAKRS